MSNIEIKMSLEISYQGISLLKKSILKAVITQLNKDLTLSGIDYQFNENLTANDFITDLQTWIKYTLLNNESVLYNFLYRVDVNQQLIYTNDGLPDENLLKLVLSRELQKVVLKKQFSSTSGKLL